MECERNGKKKQLVAHAKKGEGHDTEDVAETLDELPDKTYNSPTEVMQELSQAA